MNPNLDTGVGRLNTTGGMPIAEILRYAALRERGVGKKRIVASCWNSIARGF